MTRTRAPMKTPTKAQLAARVEYYETSLTTLLEDMLDVEGATPTSLAVKNLLSNAPSLNPADAPAPTRGKRNAPPADASENLAEGEELVEVEIRVGDEAAE